jgi:hypothetical protein
MLHQRDDFADLLTIVGESIGAGAAIVEKDYWVTEALRVIADAFGDGVVFKGGTSLSKGWNLIQRFSEDIDLLVRSEGEGRETGGELDRFMRSVADAVETVEGLGRTAGGRSERGVSRTAEYGYQSISPARRGLDATVILEMGIRGGAYPTTIRPLQSLVGAALSERGIVDEGVEPFDMVVLNPERTLVEKLFALDSSCLRWAEGEADALRRQSRHLADISALLAEASVAGFVGTAEYLELIVDVDLVGQKYFPTTHRTPEGLRFASSKALTTDSNEFAALRDDYQQSQYLFYGGVPVLDDLVATIAVFRDRL